ncbi:MAG: SCO family protein [Archangium sp.]|nr:SCO family protein [Archangium sp.]
MSIASPHSGRLPAVQLKVAIYRRPLLWVSLLLLLIAGLVVYRVVAPRESLLVQLPVLSTVPAFAFVDQSGAAFGSDSLKGRVWVANFIFTRCPNICPKFTAKMGTLQDRSAQQLPALGLVSFTVDPEHDTPEVLTAYGEKHHADFKRWHFLRGERPELERVIRNGMLQPMDPGDGKDLNTVVHGSYFALVDAQLQVRGVYRFSEPGSVDEVLRDAKLLLP